MESGFSGLGKIIVLVGAGLVLIGAIFLLLGRIPWFGRLPGDIEIKRDSFTFFFPVVTCILISIVLTIILWVISLLSRR